MKSYRICASVAILSVNLVLHQDWLLAAPEPWPPPEPIGHYDYETGTFSDHLVLPITDPRTLNPALIIPTGLEKFGRQYFSHEWPGYDLSIEADEATLGIQIGIGDASPTADPGHGPHVYQLADGMVSPVFAVLYAVSLTEDEDDVSTLILDRVNDELPEEQRPRAGYRVISASATKSPLFMKLLPPQFPVRGNVVILSFQQELDHAPTATIKVVPPPVSRIQAATPFEVTIAAGDLISTQFQSYRVARVVPPFESKVGPVVGWIELELDPLPGRPATPE